MFAFLAVGIATSVPLPEPIIEPARIAALIRDLDADEFRTRDRATKELRAIGMPAIDTLKGARPQARSLEFQDRCEKLTREIRFAATESGESVSGMHITLRTERDVFRLGEPVRMQLEICSARYASSWLFHRHWGYSHTYGPEKYLLRMIVLDDDEYENKNRFVPSTGIFELHQTSGVRVTPKKLQDYVRFIGLANRFSQPGEIIREDLNLNRLGELTAGDYELQFSIDCFLEIGSKSKWKTVRSNTVRFTIE